MVVATEVSLAVVNISGVEVVGNSSMTGASTTDGVDVAAGVPGFVVAPPVASTVEPHAPSEVLITPPSIYIHFGAEVPLSYIVTPEAAPPPIVNACV